MSRKMYVIMTATPTAIPAAETLQEALPSISAVFLSSSYGDFDLFSAITTMRNKIARKTLYIQSLMLLFNVRQSYRPAQLRCQWTAYMEQFTRSLTFTGPLVALIQAPAKVLPVPSLRVSGPRTTVRSHCDCIANLAPIINIQTYDVPTYLLI